MNSKTNQGLTVIARVYGQNVTIIHKIFLYLCQHFFFSNCPCPVYLLLSYACTCGCVVLVIEVMVVVMCFCCAQVVLVLWYSLPQTIWLTVITIFVTRCNFFKSYYTNHSPHKQQRHLGRCGAKPIITIIMKYLNNKSQAVSQPLRNISPSISDRVMDSSQISYGMLPSSFTASKLAPLEFRKKEH